MDYLLVICTVSPASCHGHFYLLGRPLEKLWEEVGWVGWVGGQAHTCKINSRENSQRNNGHVNKKIHAAQKLPNPCHNFSN